jgi:hypothetical protein
MTNVPPNDRNVAGAQSGIRDAAPQSVLSGGPLIPTGEYMIITDRADSETLRRLMACLGLSLNNLTAPRLIEHEPATEHC